MQHIAVIGAGAAGFFAAIHAAEKGNAQVVIFEKSNKVLSKVRISGGGRCNVMHNCFDAAKLCDHYPRGRKELRNAFARFGPQQTLEWFQSKGVKLKAEEDGRMFPVTDDSATIVNCLLKEAENNLVQIELHKSVDRIEKVKNKFHLFFADDTSAEFDKIIITAGGNPHLKSYDWIKTLGHTIQPPVPSLFTFNIPQSSLKGLEGVSVQQAVVKIKDFKHTETGPVLITHWGLSGPAVIKQSAWAARELFNRNYETVIYINWLPAHHVESVRDEIESQKTIFHNRKVYTTSPFELPSRLWIRICELAGITEDENYADLSKVKLNKLCELLTNMSLQLKGKTTYKEEFVTCGGVNLKEINMQTMESKIVKGLFFAGEVLDIDGITGGFNFQAVWSTGYLAGINSVS